MQICFNEIRGAYFRRSFWTGNLTGLKDGQEAARFNVEPRLNQIDNINRGWASLTEAHNPSGAVASESLPRWIRQEFSCCSRQAGPASRASTIIDNAIRKQTDGCHSHTSLCNVGPAVSTLLRHTKSN
ncbi:hypothetical protein HN011_008489 [Eciton burchellii]|nr:hypothetical protein HN011_008489 [Eciton burchellii]